MNVTIKTIAQAAGVSPAAVSKALNGYTDIGEETRNRIIRISAEMGYTPNALARNLVKKTSDILGLLIPDISTPIYAEIFKGIDAEAKRRGFNLFLCDTNRKKEFEVSYIKTLMENRARGIIVAPVDNDAGHILELTKGRMPLVFVGGKVNDSMDNYVANDNKLGSVLAVEHIASLGHRDVLMLCDNYRTKTKKDRVDGYRAAMEERGLDPRVSIAAEGTDEGIEYGCRTALEVFDSGRLPTAIYASSDMVALGVMRAAAMRGIVIPRDLSLVGYDDIMFASLPTVNLTTIAQPKFEIGALAVELLCEAIDAAGTGEKHRRVLKPSLVVRGSCIALRTSTPLLGDIRETRS
jgi:LacI family transcriptional regulator